MGKQKDNWRRKYSSARPNSRNLNRPHWTSTFGEGRFTPTHAQSMPFRNPSEISEEIYRIVCEESFGLNRDRLVSDSLSHRMYSPDPLVLLGIIEDFDIPIVYVKPVGYAGDLNFGKKLGVSLTPYHQTNYIVTLRSARELSVILIAKESDGHLIGAANFTSTDRREFNYPPLLYDPPKIDSLFNFKCIKPYPPSPNYRKIDHGP
jgi:hypothetical protein